MYIVYTCKLCLIQCAHLYSVYCVVYRCYINCCSSIGGWWWGRLLYYSVIKIYSV